MSLKEINENDVIDINGAYSSKVSTKNNPFAVPRGLKLYVVKARRTGGCTVLTCPYAEVGEYYHVCVDDDGVISFIPVALAVGSDE